MKKLVAFLVCLTILAALLAGCGAAKSESIGSAAAPDYNYRQESGSGSPATEAPAEDYEKLEDSLSTGTSNTSAPSAVIKQKLVRTVYISAETEDLDALLQQIDAKIAALGGYAENREVYNGSPKETRRYRRATLTVRIPAEQLDSFLSEVNGMSNVTSSTESVDDITLNYVDVHSRVLALETEQARLLELLAKAETMSDLLQIEDRLTDVRAELERYSSQLRVMDSQVNYSTIHLNLSEVKEYTVVTEPETVGERISSGFVNSLENLGTFFVNLFVFFIVALPYLIILAVVTITPLGIIFWRKKRKKSKNSPPAENK